MILAKDKPKKIVLKDAGISSKAIHDYDIDLDDENGVAVYEIDFNHKNKEYDYTVDVHSGKILKKNVKRD